MKPEIKERIEQIKNGQVPQGYKKTKIGVVPNEWEVVKANTVFKNISDKSHNGELEVLSATQDKGVIPRKNIDIDIKYDKSNLKNYKIIKKGNFVISLRSFQGGIEYSEYDGIVSPAYTVLEECKEIKRAYYKMYFKSINYINQLNVAVYGIRDGKQISYNDFGYIKIPFPPLSEQQKIADILSTQDKVIELKEKLISEKQNQKKYLMQTLLTGKKRLKGFTGEWKNKSICDVFKITRGEVLATSFIRDEQDDEYLYPVYSSQTKNNGLLGYYNKALYQNAITWTTDGANAGSVAFRKGKFFCTNVCGVLLDDKGNANECIAGILNSKTKYYVSYVGNPKLMNGTMGEIKINFPPIEEQTAIANILTTADKEIELLQKDLEQEKQKKKALMQLLLTGIVRV